MQCWVSSTPETSALFPFGLRCGGLGRFLRLFLGGLSFRLGGALGCHVHRLRFLLSSSNLGCRFRWSGNWRGRRRHRLFSLLSKRLWSFRRRWHGTRRRSRLRCRWYRRTRIGWRGTCSFGGWLLHRWRRRLGSGYNQLSIPILVHRTRAAYFLRPIQLHHGMIANQFVRMLFALAKDWRRDKIF